MTQHTNQSSEVQQVPPPLTETCDVAIIGAGPAGMSAAITLANHGQAVVVFDQQKTPGGQIYRNTENQPPAHSALLGPDYQSGAQLLQQFRERLNPSAGPQIDYRPDTNVWSINHNKEIGYTGRHGSALLTAQHIILANGAMERPVPFPGWTLPGVMNAGAAQIIFKSQQLLPEDNVVLAGSGPLLYLLAWQYLQAGLPIQALLDLTPGKNRWHALLHLPTALPAMRYLLQGYEYQRALKKAGIPIIKPVTELAAIGDDKLSAVQYQLKGGQHRLQTERLLIHFGIIPATHLSQLAGCKHYWHHSQQSWQVIADTWGSTSIRGIYSAGDAAVIYGANSAQYLGCLSALHCLASLGAISLAQRDQLAHEKLQRLKKDKSIRPFLEAWFRIPNHLFTQTGEKTQVCRCEEITAGDIRHAVRLGHEDINQVKFFTRCGMGPCQGRQCAQAVSHIVADETSKDIAEVGTYRARPPLNQLTLGELATLYPGEKE